MPTVSFNFTGSLQSFIVPANVFLVTIRAVGARGGNFINPDGSITAGGFGASIQGDFSVTPGEVLTILAGGMGGDNNTSGAGGGGGSFVWRGSGIAALNAATLLVAAGGGGGAGGGVGGIAGGNGQIADVAGNGSSGTAANAGLGGTGGTALAGGTGGAAGVVGADAGTNGTVGLDGGGGGGGGGGSEFDGGGGGGAGLSGNGGRGGDAGAGSPGTTGGNGGLAIIAGGTGGAGGIGAAGLLGPGGNGTAGGFGGGGGAGGDGNVDDDGGGGGGGGFSGGGGGGAGGDGGAGGGGGGGGSFNAGLFQENMAGVGMGIGFVEITFTPEPPPTPQPTPTIAPEPFQPECIRTQKVFDWVYLANRYQNKIQLSEACRPVIEERLSLGHRLQARCATDPDQFLPIFPLLPKPQPTPTPIICPGARCDFETDAASPVRCIAPDGTAVTLYAIPFLFTVCVRVDLVDTDADDEVICTENVFVQFDEEVALCWERGLNIQCRILDVICNASFRQLGAFAEPGIFLTVNVCKEIQVEAEVKLELLARFCQPRGPVECEVSTFMDICPPLPSNLFPAQCPSIFPGSL
ncbi:hypothetical protein [Ammoniphilus sp. 3BR4]|uniref:hypothetical protein n=1 Tax=Ammoniphilus sp. 3BR4 TaxID=3158265 RepID=UPI0034660EBF